MNEQEEKLFAELSSRLVIDILRLDDELIELPMTVQTIAEQTSFAIAKRDELKSALNQAKSESMSFLRRVNEKKPPETQIESDSILSPQFIEANRTYLNAKLDADLWMGLSDAMKTKESSIKIICSLISSGYTTIQTVTNERRKMIHEERSKKDAE